MFVFVTVWLQGTLLIAAGTLLGTGLGIALAKAISARVSVELAFTVDAAVSALDLAVPVALLVAGSLCATAPSLPFLRVSAAHLLRLT